MSAGDLARLEAILDFSLVSERIEAMLPLGVRPRQLQVRTLMLGILICLADHRPAHLRRVHRALLCLPETQKRRLGVIAQCKSGPHLLSYRQVERTFSLIVRALSKQEPDGQPSETLSEIMDALIEGSITVLGGDGGGMVARSCSYAIDWSDYESFARPARRKAGEPEQAAEGHEPSAKDTGRPERQATENENPQSKPGQQDEERCADRQAAWGHRKANHPGINEMFFGYYLQATTIVAEEHGPPIPELVARITLASCKEDPPAQIVPVIKRMTEDGIQIADLLADSGYSYRQPESFAAPMRALGASLIMDLHPNDRGIKGTHQGAIACNGNLYCPTTPKALFDLGPPAPAATEQELAAHDRKTEELAKYKLSALTAPDKDGYRRLACPAVKGKLRCPLRASSMTLSHERPTIASPPEHPPLCCTQQTITVAPNVNAKTAQKHDYPSKAHRASYARRTAAERTFSRLNNPAGTDIKRGWCRLMGLTPNAIMLTCATIIANTHTIDAFAARQAENRRRAEHARPPRKRAKRRRSAHDLTTAANAPPAKATAQAA